MRDSRRRAGSLTVRIRLLQCFVASTSLGLLLGCGSTSPSGTGSSAGGAAGASTAGTTGSAGAGGGAGADGGAGTGGMTNCLTGTCGAGSYCGDVDQDGRVDVRQCLPYPSGCDSCACATADLGSYYAVHFPGLGFPPCGCSDGHGQSIVDGGSPTLVVVCFGA